jgi:hypothetical protein
VLDDLETYLNLKSRDLKVRLSFSQNVYLSDRIAALLLLWLNPGRRDSRN